MDTWKKELQRLTSEDESTAELAYEEAGTFSLSLRQYYDDKQREWLWVAQLIYEYPRVQEILAHGDDVDLNTALDKCWADYQKPDNEG